MKKIIVFTLSILLCSIAFAQTQQEVQRKQPAAGKEIGDMFEEMFKKIQPNEEELKALQQDIDCPDCIPEDQMKINELESLMPKEQSNYPIEISQAFITDNNDFYILLGPLSRLPNADYGFGGYWGRENLLYPLQTKGGMFSSDEVQAEIINPQSEQVLCSVHLEHNIFSVSKSNEEKSLVPMSEERRKLVVQQIINGDIKLFDLSKIRKPEHLFKVKGSGIFIYIDGLRFPYKGLPHLFLGTKNNMQQYEIKNYFYFHDGGTTIIFVKDKGKVFVPQTRVPSDKKPYWQDAGSSEKQELEILSMDSATLESIGVNIKELEIPDFPNPCTVFYK